MIEKIKLSRRDFTKAVIGAGAFYFGLPQLARYFGLPNWQGFLI